MRRVSDAFSSKFCICAPLVRCCCAADRYDSLPSGEDPVPGVGSHPVLVQHGEEALLAEEARHYEDHVSFRKQYRVVLRELSSDASSSFHVIGG